MPRFHRLKVLRRLPHPGRGFTQGLLAGDGTVWESTGQYGQSMVRRYRLGQDEDEASTSLPPDLFGEGICRVGSHLWQLTWRERVALRWDLRSLTLLETISYNREGWGICNIGPCVLTSDGSSELVRRDPQTLMPLGLIVARLDGQRIGGLNDLEWAGGRVMGQRRPPPVPGRHRPGQRRGGGHRRRAGGHGTSLGRSAGPPQRRRGAARPRRVPAQREGLAVPAPRPADRGPPPQAPRAAAHLRVERSGTIQESLGTG